MREVFPENDAICEITDLKKLNFWKATDDKCPGCGNNTIRIDSSLFSTQQSILVTLFIQAVILLEKIEMHTFPQ